jgi:hypothetical protein
LVVDDDGLRHCIEVVVADQRVVPQIFSAQEAPVGGKADLPQRGQIVKSPTDLAVIGVVDRGFSAKGLPFFVVVIRQNDIAEPRLILWSIAGQDGSC